MIFVIRRCSNEIKVRIVEINRYEYEDSEPDQRYKEILKLHDMLLKGGIDHDLLRMNDGWNVLWWKDDGETIIVSAVEHCMSYGNRDDLIEIKGLLTKKEANIDDVTGWLTAEQVFGRIKNRVYKMEHGYI